MKGKFRRVTGEEGGGQVEVGKGEGRWRAIVR